MKKLLLMFLFLPFSYLNAKMIYNPVSNIFYSSENCSESEYNKLISFCLNEISEIKSKSLFQKPFENDSQKFWFGLMCRKDFIKFLKKFKTKTSKQLIKDLKKDIVFYPDGGVLCKNIVYFWTMYFI